MIIGVILKARAGSGDRIEKNMKVAISDVNKVKLAKLLSASNFWVAAFVFFIENRGFDPSLGYYLIALYYIVNVVLEYPTGVVGDYISHKVSVSIGYVMTALALLVIAVSSSVYVYFAMIIFVAFGVSLVSGSDIALLYSISKNVERDLADIKTVMAVWGVAAIAMGTFVAESYPAVPIFLTAVAFLGAAATMGFVKVGDVATHSGDGQRSSNQKNTGRANLFLSAKEGLQFIKEEKSLRKMILLFSFATAFFNSFLWLYYTIFRVLNIDLSWWWVIIVGLAVANVLGIQIYSRLKKDRFKSAVLLVISSLLLVGTPKFAVPVIAGLLIFHVGRGYLETYFEVKFNEMISSDIRASVLSLRNLVVKMMSAGYILLGGIIAEKISISVLMVITVLILGVLSYRYSRTEKKISRQSRL